MDRIRFLRERLTGISSQIMTGHVGAALLRDLAALTLEAERLGGTLAGRMLAADAWDWLGRARELGSDPADVAGVDEALSRSAHWWESAGSPERARWARESMARNRLYRSGVIDTELLRLVAEFRDPDAKGVRRAQALLELGQLQLRSGDHLEGIRALRQAAREVMPLSASEDLEIRVRERLLVYSIGREIAVVTGDAGWLRIAREHRRSAHRLIAAAAGGSSRPSPLDLLGDSLDDWDVAIHETPADPRLRHRAERLYADWSASRLPNAADVAAAIARRLADLYLREGDAHAAAALLRAATPRVPERRRHDLGVALLVRQARAEARLGQWEDAERLASAAIAQIEPLRRTVTGVRPREGYTGERIDAYHVAIEAALRRNDLERLLKVTELLRGRRLTRVRVPVQDADRVALAASVRGLRAEGHEPRFGGEESPESGWTRRLMADAWDAAGPYASLPPFDLDTLRSRLEPEEAVLSYFWLDPHHLVAVVIRHDRSWHDVLPVDAAARTVLETNTALVTGGFLNYGDVALLRTFDSLGRVLLPPSDVLADVRRLYVSPHRLLHAVPFSVLELDGRPLIDLMTVVLAPSLTALARPRSSPGVGELAAVDIADFRNHTGLRNLDLIAEQARDACRSWHSRGRLRMVLSDAEASVAALQDRHDELGKAGFLQLITHGTNPWPEMAVGPRLALFDGALDDLDLAMWQLSGPLVLLVSCYSGQQAVRSESGGELLAEELNSLTGALFAAGAEAVLGALWPAEKSFAALMLSPLHERLISGVPADEALRAAVLEVRDKRCLYRNSPYHWGPYTLTTTTLLPARSRG
ncbi:CHAT domain-containing protein [Streptosporangium sp. NPDC023963]|uniref:CHAT domain-containing protein n=1 Tax=Streptosporangium sp. NPDC023963 TaxID=3155608 RepID=UPI0034492E6F